MKKAVRIFVSVLLCILAVFLCSCAEDKEEKDNAKVIDIYASANELMGAAKFDDTMREIEHYVLPSLIGDIGAVTSSCAYGGETGATAEVLFVIYCDDLENVYTVKALLSNYRDEQQLLFASYNPTEVPKLESAVLEVRGHYLLFAVGKDVSALSGIFNGYFDN